MRAVVGALVQLGALVDHGDMSDPVALALIAGVVTLGTAFLGAWGRRMATQMQAAAVENAASASVINP